MAKDPAFLFYPGDWLGGTLGMTLEEKGGYLELLMLQFNQGKFTLAYAERTLGTRFTELWKTLKPKFKTDNNFYWNTRLLEETEKRKNFCESRRKSARGEKNKENNKTKNKKSPQQHTQQRMEDVNENEIENKNENKGGAGGKNLKPEIPNTEIPNTQTLEDFEQWTQQVIDKADPEFEIILANESCRGQPVHRDEHLVRSHETKCLREQTGFKNQQHFRKSLISYLKTATNRLNANSQTNWAGGKKLTPPGTAPRLNETGFGSL